MQAPTCTFAPLLKAGLSSVNDEQRVSASRNIEHRSARFHDLSMAQLARIGPAGKLRKMAPACSLAVPCHQMILYLRIVDRRWAQHG